MKNRWVRRAVELAIIVALLLGVRAWTQRGTLRGPAPRLEGVTLAGERVALDAYRGRPVLVHFWATWCGVCKLEQGSIDALARDHAVISVATQSGGAAEVAAFMRREGLAFPVVVDEDGTLARTFGVRAFPTSYLVDAAGEVRFVEVGYTSGPGLRARLWLAGR